MKLSHAVRYGVACLFELSKYSGEFLDAAHVARVHSIPLAYAQKILQRLAHAGLVLGQKGLGYSLARPLATITALEVIETLSAEVEPAAYSQVGNLLEEKINKALDSFTLDQLAAR